MRLSPIFIFAALSALLFPSSDARIRKVDWKPIKDPSDPYVVEIAQFAVTSYNDMDNTHKLVLVKVIKGKFTVMAYKEYVLDIEVINNGINTTEQYQTTVFDDLSNKKRMLERFFKINA